jgi:uncharacterized protein
MFIRDLGEIIDRATTADGFVRVKARFARTGVQHYLAGEIGMTDRSANAKVGVYRPAEEVFAPASLATFAGVPVTNNHPPVMLDTANTKKYMIGFSGDTLTEEDGYMVGNLTLTDADAIKAFNAGRKEISNGYRSDIDWTAGTAPDGTTYDGIQRNIRGNHIAMVDAGRCGPACRIIDEKALTDCSCGDHTMADVTVIVDSISYTMPDQIGAVMNKILVDRKAAQDLLTAAQNTIAARDASIVTLTGERDAAKAALPTGAALDAMLADRVAVFGKAAKILGAAVTLDGKTAGEVKRLVVAAKMGETAKDYTDAQFDAAFGALTVAAPGKPADTVRAGILKDGVAAAADAADPVALRDAAWKDAQTALAKRWQGNTKGTA